MVQRAGNPASSLIGSYDVKHRCGRRSTDTFAGVTRLPERVPLMFMLAELRLHIAGFDFLIPSLASLPSAVTLRADRFSRLQVFVARATLMVQRALIAGNLDAAFVFAFARQLSRRFG